MSTDLTTDKPADTVTSYVIENRTSLARVLLAIGVLALAAGVYFTYRAMPTSSTVAKDADKEKEKEKEKDKEKDPFEKLDLKDKDKEKEKEGTLSGQTGQVLWAISGFMFGVVFLGVGLMLIAGIPKPTRAGQESDARVAILALGGLSGVTMMVAATYVLITSFKDLVKWVDEQTPPEGAIRLVAALLVFLVGCGLAFLAAQPARAEERNNPRLRRLVYGSNVALLAVLLVLVLVIGNVLIALKVPQRLDTTETGFHSLTLSQPTREYLAGLSQPVTAYTAYPEDAGRVPTDARRMLDAMRNVNPEKFRVRYLSPTLNRTEITTLRNRFPQVDQSLNGILLTVGEDEKQYSFIRTMDLVETEMAGRRPKELFVGEKKVVGELLFLSENKTRPVVYFTTGHGELSLDMNPNPVAGPEGTRRPATRLRAALDKMQVDLRPLQFEIGKAQVPDDASMVIIADPRAAIPPDQIAALRKYMGDPRTDPKKKGKLIVLSGPYPDAQGQGAVETNLPALLAEFGVGIGQEFLYREPEGQFGFTDFVAGVTQQAADARNPIAMEYAGRGVVLWNCREVQVARGGTSYDAKVLFVTATDDATWLEAVPPENPVKALSELRDPQVQRAKRASNRPRPLAAVVSEGPVGRIIVIGSGDSFADDPRRGLVVDRNTRLLAQSVNWLRDRPPVGDIATKTYGYYVPNASVSEVQVYWLPVGVTLLGIIALGLGVWVFRRK